MQTFCAVGNLVISQLGNDGWSVERKPNYLHTPTNPPTHQPMPCHAISYYIILHHSISAHAMIFNTIPSHTIFPSTNTALTIWVLSSCALCFWPGVHCTLCTQWCDVVCISQLLHTLLVARCAFCTVCKLIWNIYHRLLIRFPPLFAQHNLLWKGELK